MKRHDVWLVTWFGVGRSPRAPGTWGSLAALPLAYALHTAGGTMIALAAVALLCVFAVPACTRYAAVHGDDPSSAVVDEVAGQCLALAFTPPSLHTYTLGFLLFRLFDIVKPRPISDLERLPGGLGIMLDDIAAGACAALVLFFLREVIW